MTREQQPPAGDSAPPPSKSQLKRDAQAIKELGEQLIALPGEQLERLALDEQLATAIRQARKLRRGGALKRQVQYVAKLLRARDTTQVQRALDQIEGHSRESAQQFHKLERWREGLLDNDPATLDELYREHVTVDRQHLNQLVRMAQRERDATAGAVAHYRKLFRYLRELEERASSAED